MNNIIFAKTRWHYDSYTDYWQLVQLSGFPFCFVDEIDITSDNVYIVSPMNGEMEEFATNKDLLGSKAKIFLWNLERPGGSGGIKKYKTDCHRMKNIFDRVIVSDRALANDCDLDYMTLGVHESLGSVGRFEDKHYDLIHLSCYSNHRSFMFDDPSNPKTRLGSCTIATNGWGEQRHNNLMQSKFMLCIHQDEFPYIEPQRFALAVMYGLPIISEGCKDWYPYDNYITAKFNDIFLYNNFKYIPSYTKDLYDLMLQQRLFMLEHFNFRDCIEKAVEGFLK